LRHRKCWEKLKDAATRCYLRPVDASKCVNLRPGLCRGAYSAPLDLLAAFGEGNGEGGTERTMDGKATEGERKARGRKREKRRGRGIEGSGGTTERGGGMGRARDEKRDRKGRGWKGRKDGRI